MLINKINFLKPNIVILTRTGIYKPKSYVDHIDAAISIIGRLQYDDILRTISVSRLPKDLSFLVSCACRMVGGLVSRHLNSNYSDILFMALLSCFFYF